jgi:hypothetical protein
MRYTDKEMEQALCRWRQKNVDVRDLRMALMALSLYATAEELIAIFPGTHHDPPTRKQLQSEFQNV